MLMTLRGTPFLYYGEEIGMSGMPIPRHLMVDPLGLRYWPFHPGRDPERTPMQWNLGKNAGFSSGKPWLPMASDAKTQNVMKETFDPSSLLNWYRSLIRYRRSREALQIGNYQALSDGKDGVFSWVRFLGTDANISAANFTEHHRSLKLPEGMWKVVLSSGTVLLEEGILNLEGLGAALLEKIEG